MSHIFILHQNAGLFNSSLHSQTMSNHTIIQGFHEGHPLLYLQEERHLFVRSNERSGQVEYACYEKHRSNRYKNPNHQEENSNCTARVFLKDGVVRRNSIQHKNHENHELIFRDLQTLNAVKEKSRMLLEWCPLSSSKVSAKELLATELAKYVHILFFDYFLATIVQSKTTFVHPSVRPSVRIHFSNQRIHSHSYSFE